MKSIVLVMFCVAAMAASVAGAAQALARKSPTSEKKVYELPKTGKNIQRQNGGWINAEAVGTRFVLKVFDPEKKPAAPDMEKGFVQFRYPSKNPEPAPLYFEGQTLVTPATVRPPHNFLVILTLSAAEDAGPTESYTFKYP